MSIKRRALNGSLNGFSFKHPLVVALRKYCVFRASNAVLDAVFPGIVLQAQEDLFQCSFGLIDLDISITILAHCVMTVQDSEPKSGSTDDWRRTVHPASVQESSASPAVGKPDHRTREIL